MEINIKEEIKKIKSDVEALKTATWYTDSYIMHDSACDSSSRCATRMHFVKEAQKVMINKHRKKILELASQLWEKQLEGVNI